MGDKTLFLLLSFILLIVGTVGDKKSLSALSNASNVSQNATTPISGSAIVYDSSVSTLGDRLTLNWVLPNNSDIIHFQLVCKCTGWVALGLGAGMGPATDMMVGRVSTSGQVIINDYWSEEEETPDEDEEEGGTNDLILLSGSQINGITTISFSRKLVSMDKYDQNISIGWNEIVLAFQPDSFELKDHHENMAIGKILVVRGGPGKGLVAGGYTFSRIIHGLIMTVCWLGIFALGALIGRYGRYWPSVSPLWFKYHQNVQTGAIIAASVGLLVQFFNAPIHFATPYHGWLGLLVMFGATFQVGAAVFRPHKDAPVSPLRRYWELSHSIGGKFLFPLSWICILSGLWYLRAPGILLAVLFLYVVSICGFVGYTEMKKREDEKKKDAETPPSEVAPKKLTSDTDEVPLDTVL